MTNKKKTLVLGASENPARYSHLAMHRLHRAGHPVIAIGKKKGAVAGVPIVTEKIATTGVDTVTMYLNPQHQKEYYEYLLALQPRRIIFNPGSENDELAEMAREHNITVQEACTLVLLSSGQY